MKKCQKCVMWPVCRFTEDMRRVLKTFIAKVDYKLEEKGKSLSGISFNFMSSTITEILAASCRYYTERTDGKTILQNFFG